MLIEDPVCSHSLLRHYLNCWGAIFTLPFWPGKWHQATVAPTFEKAFIWTHQKNHFHFQGFYSTPKYILCNVKADLELIKTNKESETRWNWKCIFLKFENQLYICWKFQCPVYFLFLKVSNWSVTFLSLAHVLFISASISSTWPPSPAAACEFKLLFIQTPKLCQGTADQTRQTNIMLPRWKRTSKELQKLMWASFTQQLS